MFCAALLSYGGVAGSRHLPRLRRIECSLALYDVPWVPMYLGVIFILHPMQGFVATGGAIVLFVLTLLNELITSPLTKEANSAAINSQRRADSIARNAEAIDSMGMMPAVMRRWQES